MSEKSMRRRVIRALRPLHGISVENVVHAGTPDVAFAGGWIELKHAPRWPAKDGILRMPHFTQEQRLWLSQHWRCGGLAWLLLQVERENEWLLFRGNTAAEELGQADRTRLRRVAERTWRGAPTSCELRRALLTRSKT